jgi:hypothetical protein
MTALTFRCSDPARNLHRYHRLDVRLDLFGPDVSSANGVASGRPVKPAPVDQVAAPCPRSWAVACSCSASIKAVYRLGRCRYSSRPSPLSKDCSSASPFPPSPSASSPVVLLDVLAATHPGLGSSSA